MVAIVQGGKTYLIATTSSQLEVFEFQAGSPPDFVRVGGTPYMQGLGAMVLRSPDANTLYVAMASGSSVYPYSFRSIHKVDVSALPTITVDSNALVTLPVDCYNADIHPNGLRLVVACHGGELYDVDIVNRAFTNIPHSPAIHNGSIAIEPTLGNFAYLSGSAPNDPILVLDLTSNPLTVSSTTIPGPGPTVGVWFHSSGKWAFVLPGSPSAQSFWKLDTSTSWAPATVLTPAASLATPVQAAGIAIGSDRLYTSGYGSLLAFDIDLSTGVLTEVLPRLPLPANAQFGIPREAYSKITAKAIPATAPLTVSLNNLPGASATSLVVPGGTVLPLDSLMAYQPSGYTTQTERWAFQGWAKNAPCSGTPPISMATFQSDPVPAGFEDVYCACFEKQWYLNVTVSGSCTATPSGWHPEGGTPTFNVTAPSGTTVAVTGDATASGQTIAMDQPRSVTVNCTSTTGPGGCSLLSSHPDLVGWYRFEEPSSQTAFVDSATGPVALNAVGTVQRGTGKVVNAVYFDTTPFPAQLFTPGGGSAATSTTSPAKYNFGTGPFSIDFWINLNGSLPNGRPILQKMSGLAANEVPFPIGSPRPPEFGYRLRTIAGEFLELELASNGTFAKYAGSVAMPVNQWVHVTVVVPRGSNLPVFYINGVPQTASGPATFTGTIDNTAPLLVGDIAGPGTLGGPGRATAATRFWVDELELFKTALTQADVTGLVSAGSAGKCVPGGTGCTPPPPGMITWYTLDGQTSGEQDIAGSARTQLNWTGNPQSVTGRVGRALLFTTQNYAEAANAAEGSITTSNLTIDAWIRTSTSGTVQTFVDKRVLSPLVRGYSFFLSNGSLAFQMADASGASSVCSAAASSACTNWVSSSANLADGNWHHVAVTVNRTSTTGGTFYVDGQQIGVNFNPTIRQGSLASTALLRIGSHASGGQYAGEVDELEIFDRDLTAAEIKAIFDAGPVGKCRDNCAPQPAGMSAWWRFEEPAGPDFNDAAGSINDVAQIGPAGIQRVPGYVGQAVRFNTDTQRLTVPASLETQFPGDGSIDLWVRTLGNPLVPIVDRYDSSNNFGYQFYIQNGRLVLKLFSPGTSGTWTSNLPVPVNAWTFLAVTFSRPGTPVFYVNGAVDTTPSVAGAMPVGPIIPNVPLLIGGLRPIGAPVTIEASFDELEIFQRALTTTEVLAIFNAGPLGKCIDASQFPVRVETLPAAIGATVGLSAPTPAVGTATNVYTYTNGTAGSYQATATPAILISGGTHYTLTNWSFNGNLDATLGTGSPTTAKSVTGASTFRANYRVTGYEVTVNNTANCAVSASGQSQASTFTFVAPVPGAVFLQPGTGNPTTVTLSSGATLTLPATINPSGPVTITPNCAGTFTVTVNTTPVSLGVTVGLSAPANVAGTGTNIYSNSNATADTYIATATPSTIVSGTQ
ncbi:MAG: LamG-like jellyroll fold domain-containing protein, partial [Bryobacteraceae bacterium]|nr:LamG-like jellyroll fold domain-containing protein [Bryobacteraceae bacterium]